MVYFIIYRDGYEWSVDRTPRSFEDSQAYLQDNPPSESVYILTANEFKWFLFSKGMTEDESKEWILSLESQTGKVPISGKL